MSRVISDRLNVSPYAVFTAERQGGALIPGESFAFGNGGGQDDNGGLPGSGNNTRLNWGPSMPYAGTIIGVSFFSSYDFVTPANKNDEYNNGAIPADDGGTSFTFTKIIGGNGGLTITSAGEYFPEGGVLGNPLVYYGYPSFSVNQCVGGTSTFNGCTFYYTNMNTTAPDASVLNFDAGDVIFYQYNGEINLPTGTYIMSLMVRFYPDPQFDLDEF